MLLIDTIVQPSGIHGLGCFTTESIRRGQTIWVYDRRLDLSITESEVLKLPKPTQSFLYCYCYVVLERRRRHLILCGDNSRYMNHSDSPNTADNIACRDIESGEELTCDYASFDLDAHAKILGNSLTGTTACSPGSDSKRRWWKIFS